MNDEHRAAGDRPPKILVTVSTPRSGTTHLFNVIREFPNLRVYAEIFNPVKAFGLDGELNEALTERRGKPLPSDRDDPETIDYVRSHPHQVLSAMEDLAGDRTVVVKLFPGHLDIDFVCEELLPRDDVAVIVVHRRVLDCYASVLKARQLQAWQRTDTTNMLVNGQIDHFASWARQNQEWFGRCGAALEGTDRSRTINYEEHLDVERDRVTHHVANVLGELGLRPGEPDARRGLSKQDLTPSAADKFDNWPEFRAELERRDLLDVAMGHFV